jgi:hypothetical protein
MGSSNIVSELRGLEFEPRPCIIPLRVIFAYRSSYGGARVAQTGGPSERSGRALADMQ